MRKPANTTSPSRTTTRPSGSSGITPTSITTAAGPYAAKQDHARALNDYNRAVELDKDNHDLFNDRGSSYAELGDLHKALADFDKAIALKPDYALGHSNRRWVLAQRNKHDEAVVEYSEAIRLAPGNPDNLNDRGWSLIKIEQYDRPSPTLTRRSASSRNTSTLGRIAAGPIG